MPTFIIRTINRTFEACDEGRDYDSLKSARESAVLSGIDIARDEIATGTSSAIIIVSIEGSDGIAKEKIAVAVSVSDIHLPDVDR